MEFVFNLSRKDAKNAKEIIMLENEIAKNIF